MTLVHPFNRIFSKTEKEDLEQHVDIKDEVTDIEVSQITPNRYQPRTIFDEEKIEELARTIHTHGMIQPIVVREIDDGYELIAGERRWRAVQFLEWETVSVIIRDMNEREVASVALIENLQREELTVIEEAKAYQDLIDLHELTQEALAQRLGKSQSTIANKIRLLHLSEVIQTAILDRKITERHARALIKLKDNTLQEKLLEKIIEQDLNVKQTEDEIKRILDPDKTKKEKPKAKKISVSRDVRIAMNTIRQSLNMVSKTGMSVESEEEDHGEYVQITIKLPKNK